MPRNPRKRPRSCEISQVAPSGGVEVLSLDIVGGRTTKKRTFEVVFYDIPPPKDDSPFGDDSDDAPRDSEPTDPKGPSRSASVYLSFYPLFVLFG
jgi:hypothetical protein